MELQSEVLMHEPVQTLSEHHEFIAVIYETYNQNVIYGSRSNKSVNYFHNYIKEKLVKIFDKPEYTVVLEHNVKSENASNCKKCDIVVLKNGEPYIVFPVKIVRTNYKKNKNNYWENTTCEQIQMKWANAAINIIPINIFMNKTPVLSDKKVIQKFETISMSDISIYDILVTKNIAYDMINYIMVVDHNNYIQENFDKPPTIIGFDEKTPYRNLFDVVKELL